MFIYSILVVIACLYAVTLAASPPPLQLVLFNTTEMNKYGARCLDGSPSGFYYRGNLDAASANKWVINTVGGGWCLPDNTLPEKNNCFARRYTTQGSSVNWSITGGQGPAPDYATNYNVVSIPYCSGDLHTGTRKSAINGLYYSGHNTVVATIEKLIASYNLGAATEILARGGSAGGIGVFVNLDWMQTRLPNVQKWFAYPNAGWFLFVTPLKASALSMDFVSSSVIANGNGYVNVKCRVAYPSTPHVCLGGNFSYPFLKATPFFIAESFYDAQQLPQNGAALPSSNIQVNNYALSFGQTMSQTLIQVKNTANSGMFITANYTHGVDETVLLINGKSIMDWLTLWHNNPTGGYKEIDNCGTGIITPNCEQPFP